MQHSLFPFFFFGSNSSSRGVGGRGPEFWGLVNLPGALLVSAQSLSGGVETRSLGAESGRSRAPGGDVATSRQHNATKENLTQHRPRRLTSSSFLPLPPLAPEKECAAVESLSIWIRKERKRASGKVPQGESNKVAARPRTPFSFSRSRLSLGGRSTKEGKPRQNKRMKFRVQARLPLPADVYFLERDSAAFRALLARVRVARDDTREREKEAEKRSTRLLPRRKKTVKG